MRILAAILSSLLLSVPAGASSTFRCDSRLVELGDTTGEVLLTCGEPLTKENVAVTSSGSIDKLVEMWIYNPGEGSFLKLLTFEGGKLAAIEDGERQ